jgi:hypothetical protein
MQKLAIVAEIFREISTDIRVMSGYGIPASEGIVEWSRNAGGRASRGYAYRSKSVVDTLAKTARVFPGLEHKEVALARVAGLCVRFVRDLFRRTVVRKSCDPQAWNRHAGRRQRRRLSDYREQGDRGGPADWRLGGCRRQDSGNSHRVRRHETADDDDAAVMHVPHHGLTDRIAPIADDGPLRYRHPLPLDRNPARALTVLSPQEPSILRARALRQP